MAGQKYGRLTVQEEWGRTVLATCDCGATKEYTRGNVLAGYTKSCGCYRNEQLREVVVTHGGSGTPLYIAWKRMNRRCYDPNSTSYRYYGGKGIRVCDRWLNYEFFREDMEANYKEGLALDRIDSSKDYSPDNCQWLTVSDNVRKRWQDG